MDSARQTIYLGLDNDDAPQIIGFYWGMELNSYKSLNGGNRIVAYIQKNTSITNCEAAGFDAGPFTAVFMKDNASVTKSGEVEARRGAYVRQNSQLTMSGNAKICNLDREGVFDYGGKVVLKEKAQISGNRGDYQINMMEETGELRLEDNAKVGPIASQEGEEETQETKDAVRAMCPMYLDGTVQIDGSIYLANWKEPLIMTSQIHDSAPDGKYELHVAEGFVGRAVVIPQSEDPRSERVETTVTDVSGQIKYFEKVKGDGVAAPKELMPSKPNIVLDGENNVYISYKGDDNNSGLTPATAVKTFARAKALLEGAGEFHAEANIIVCDPLSTTSGEEWAFNPDGKVTNSITGDEWTPIVTAYEGFEGIDKPMFGFSGNMTFRNITIKDIQLSETKGPGAIFSVYFSGKLTLGEGCIIEEITGDAAPFDEDDAYRGVIASIDDRGSLIIDGAAIQSCTLNMIAGNEDGETLGRSLFYSEGSFEMRAGTIANNNVTWHEPFVFSDEEYYNGLITIFTQVNTRGSTFRMTGGSIENNIITNDNGGAAVISVGAAEEDEESLVQLEGGNISSNQVIVEDKDALGGAVIYMGSPYATVLEENIRFEMTGGALEGNKITHEGVDYVGSKIYGAICIRKNTCASISGGSIQGNESPRTSAIYYERGANPDELIISGGTIAGNTLTGGIPGTGLSAPICISGQGFELAGGGADIQDAIYLDEWRNVITLSSPIYQTDRQYKVYLKNGGFHPGYAVIVPDNNKMSDVRGYIGNFRVFSPYVLDQGLAHVAPSNVTGGTIMEDQCLILMKPIFIDGSVETSGDGTTPDSAVKTFKEAVEKGAAPIINNDENTHYIIYVSGAVSADGPDGETWSLPETSYMCRYTGFDLYNENGETIYTDDAQGYTGKLIVVGENANLTLGDAEKDEPFRIFGRRPIDPDSYNGDSLIGVSGGASLTIEDAFLSRNNNTGIDPNGRDPLPGKGGGICVDAEGSLHMKGGTIDIMSAVNGAAIYVAGEVTLSGSPEIQGDVHLSEAAEGQPDTVVQVENGYTPGGENGKLYVTVADDWDGRPVVQYETDHPISAEEQEYFTMDDYILSVYDLQQKPDALHQLVLMKRQMYFLDGQKGNDNNNGSTPKKAFKTLEKLYEVLSEKDTLAGTAVYVVGSIEITDAITLVNYSYKPEGQGDASHYYRGYYQKGEGKKISISTQVTFMRYLSPDGAEILDGFADVPTWKGPLFDVTGNGSLTLKGTSLDGGANGTTYLLGNDGESRITAPGCGDAESSLIRVSGKAASVHLGVMRDDGELAEGDEAIYAESVHTTLNNNRNLTAKPENDANKIGELDGKPVYQGSSAGLEILSGASASLEYAEFLNLTLGSDVTGGSDIYTNGTLEIGADVNIVGSVYLEGLGEDKGETSRYITLKQAGNNWIAAFDLRMRDPYFSRKVVQQPAENAFVTSDAGYYLLEEMINDYYFLGIRENEEYILELTPPPVVYIDGVKGMDEMVDTDGERLLGSSPSNPVRTLEKAYELMQNRSVNILYVVDTVTIGENTDITLSGTSYLEGTETSIALQNHLDTVEIRRYVKPIAGDSAAGASYDDDYAVNTFTGPLFQVESGASLTMESAEGKAIDIDGHKNPRTNTVESDRYRTTEGAEATAPLIVVEKGGELTLRGDVNLHDNKNIAGQPKEGLVNSIISAFTGDDTVPGTPGGAVHNSGKVTFDGARFTDNEALKGAGIYQNGEFTITDTITGSQPVGLRGQEIYLTSVQLSDGSSDGSGEPQWGDDHVIHSDIWLKDPFGAGDNGVLDLNMDHAVKGRGVVVYDETLVEKVNPDGVDPQHTAYRLGETVPKELFLAQCPKEDQKHVLELQNWDVLDVSVPEEIFLAVYKDGQEFRVMNGAAESGALEPAVYSITNNGSEPVDVYVKSAENWSDEAEVKDDYKALTLVDREAIGAPGLSDEESQNQLYLGITGAADNPFAGMDPVSLAELGAGGNDAGDSGAAQEIKMGRLEAAASGSAGAEEASASTGSFAFEGYAAEAFLDAYKDPSFPMTGVDADTRKSHYRNAADSAEDPGAAGSAPTAKNARAALRITYRIEPVERNIGQGE